MDDHQCALSKSAGGFPGNIGNFIKWTEAVDRKRSVFVTVGQDIEQFDKLVLRNDILKSCPAMFRMKERTILVLTREDLVRRLRKQE